MELNLPTGIPFVYELDENLKPVDSMVFLGDEETVKKAMAAVAAQGKAKWFFLFPSVLDMVTLWTPPGK